MNSKYFNAVTDNKKAPVLSYRELTIARHSHEISKRDSDRINRVIEGAYNIDVSSPSFHKDIRTASAVSRKARRSLKKKTKRNFHIWKKALEERLI